MFFDKKNDILKIGTNIPTKNNFSIKLFNINGILVLNKEFLITGNKFEINAMNLNNGLYFYCITDKFDLKVCDKILIYR
jgi:hypothetical protein